MQGLLQEAGLIQPRPPREDKFRNIPLLTSSKESIRTPSLESRFRANKNEKKPIVKPKLLLNPKEKTEIVDKREQKFTHRSMQTERSSDVIKLYETGIIKYPRPGIGKSRITPRAPSIKTKGQGDSLEEGLQNLGK
ncbi:hypothetical protein NQ314_016044 [Rhamnusium bicolor]|uniref:Uncharacterized protein n=1 Tax=Rhamnusium bicolor TaxID=1586634 RepID=A0AAV8WWW2_9CUCU|nr:hypothetical protein NQ314_016044 [Rhamnusium bicolor]